MKTEFSRQCLKKLSNIKFHENSSRGRRVVPRRQTDGRTDMTKIIVNFRNFANAPTNVAKLIPDYICVSVGFLVVSKLDCVLESF
jgi:hypothetical protein